MKFLTENLFNIIGIKPEDREKEEAEVQDKVD